MIVTPTPNTCSPSLLSPAMNIVNPDDAVNSRPVSDSNNSNNSHNNEEDPATTGTDIFSKLCQEKYYGFQQLGERKVWYSDAASAYNSYRPKYPKRLLQQAVQHISGKRILEVGSGPGTASVPLLDLGYNLHCIEPNPDFCKVCRKNVKEYGAQVNVETVSLEEAVLKEGSYDAVVAATSIHWIPFDTAFAKCAKALKPRGTLVLLWNMTMNPTVPQVMDRILDVHTRTLSRLDTSENGQFSLWHFWKLGSDASKLATDVEGKLDATGLFHEYKTSQTRTQVRYTANEFVGVLSTYSPYIRLSESVRTELFHRLVQVIDSEMDGMIDLTFHSVYNVATKK